MSLLKEWILICKNNKLLCSIHKFKINIYWFDWKIHLWSKCILNDIHINHNIKPTSNRYENQINESKDVSNQIDNWVKNLESNIIFIQIIKTKTQNNWLPNFHNSIEFLCKLRSLLDEKIKIFFDEKQKAAFKIYEKMQIKMKKLYLILQNYEAYDLKSIKDVIFQAKQQISECISYINQYDDDVINHKLCPIKISSIFEFTLLYDQVFWESPKVKINTIGNDVLWSLYATPSSNNFDSIDIHHEVWDIGNLDREFFCKVEINANSSRSNDTLLTYETIASSKEKIHTVKLHGTFKEKITFRLEIQRIDPLLYIYNEKMRTKINSCL